MGELELQEGLILQTLNQANERLNSIQKDVNDVNKNIGTITGELLNVKDKVDSLDKKVEYHYKEASERIDYNDREHKAAMERLTIVEQKVTPMEKKVDNIEKWMDTNEPYMKNIREKKQDKHDIGKAIIIGTAGSAITLVIVNIPKLFGLIFEAIKAKGGQP